MKTTYILLVSFSLLFSCKELNNKNSSNKLKVNHDSIKIIDKNKSPQIELNCFTKSDLHEVDLLFKSIIIKKNEQNSFFIFDEKDLIILKKELADDGFESYLFKNKDIKCNPFISLEIFYRDKFDDGDEIHYSERSRMYRIYRNNNKLILEFLATAG